jgi:hypothetical protein
MTKSNENAEVSEIDSILRSYGPAFYGSDREAPEIAEQWAYYFSASEAGSWMAAGFWCHLTAKKVAELDIAPHEVSKLCEGLPNLNHYEPDGPVYAMCNGDLSVDVLLTKETNE